MVGGNADQPVSDCTKADRTRALTRLNGNDPFDYLRSSPPVKMSTMAEPKSEYVEFRNDGYNIAASRVSLDAVVYAFRRGESPETILKHFPAIGSLAKVYAAIAFRTGSRR